MGITCKPIGKNKSITKKMENQLEAKKQIIKKKEIKEKNK